MYSKARNRIHYRKVTGLGRSTPEHQTRCRWLELFSSGASVNKVLASWGTEHSNKGACRQSDKIRKISSAVMRPKGRDRTQLTIRGGRNTCPPPPPAANTLLPGHLGHPRAPRLPDNNTLRKSIQSLLIDPNPNAPESPEKSCQGIILPRCRCEAAPAGSDRLEASECVLA